VGIKKNAQQSKERVQATTTGWDALLVIQPSTTQPISSLIDNIPKRGCDLAWNLLQKLQEAVDALESNTNISYAEEGDELAGFSREAAISSYGMVENAEIWEVAIRLLTEYLALGGQRKRYAQLYNGASEDFWAFALFLGILSKKRKWWEGCWKERSTLSSLP